MKSSELDIAILATDEVREEYVDAHGDYPDMFRLLLEKAAEWLDAGRAYHRSDLPCPAL